MRICFVVPHLKTAGGIRVALTYADELARLGHEVKVVALEGRVIGNLLNNFFKKRVSWLPGFNSKVMIGWSSYKGLGQEVGKYKPDLIIADSWPVASWLSKTEDANKNFHLIQHDERLYHGDANLVREVYASPLKKIVVSTWLKDMLARDFNQPAQVLLNSFDREIFKPKPEAKPDDGLLRVLILDHSYGWKGTKEAVEMVNNLKLKYPNLRLMAFGARRSQPVNDYDEYYYQPAQSELANIYSRADIFLCTSWDEGFGLPSLEAMACGTAVVTYDNGGSRDFAIEGETALVAPRQDRPALAAKLEQLINDQELRQKIAQNGLALAKSWPTWEEQTIKLEKILKNGITL